MSQYNVENNPQLLHRPTKEEEERRANRPLTRAPSGYNLRERPCRDTSGGKKYTLETSGTGPTSTMLTSSNESTCSDPSPSSVDTTQIPITIEEPWSTKAELRLESWCNKAKIKAVEHDKAGYRTKNKHRMIGFMVLLSSCCVFIINALTPECAQSRIDKIILAIFSAINIFWSSIYAQADLSSRSRLHFQYNEQYTSYIEDIEYILTRNKDFRRPADTVLTEYRERLKKLYLEPELPSSRWFFC